MHVRQVVARGERSTPASTASWRPSRPGTWTWPGGSAMSGTTTCRSRRSADDDPMLERARPAARVGPRRTDAARDGRAGLRGRRCGPPRSGSIGTSPAINGWRAALGKAVRTSGRGIPDDLAARLNARLRELSRQCSGGGALAVVLATVVATAVLSRFFVVPAGHELETARAAMQKGRREPESGRSTRTNVEQAEFDSSSSSPPRDRRGRGPMIEASRSGSRRGRQAEEPRGVQLERLLSGAGPPGRPDQPGAARAGGNPPAEADPAGRAIRPTLTRAVGKYHDRFLGCTGG